MDFQSKSAVHPYPEATLTRQRDASPSGEGAFKPLLDGIILDDPPNC
jgi:hypothetical protein